MPRIRADLVDVYIFRRSPAIEFLQLFRAPEPGSALAQTWQPIMGHIEDGETAAACALRELKEEAGLAVGDPALLGVWALEGVHPFYIAGRDAIMLSPRFAAEAAPGWRPTLNEEHTDSRWVADVGASFMWPGQRAAIAELLEMLRPGSLSRDRLRIV